MDLKLTVRINGVDATYRIQPSEWRKWEKETGKTITEAASSLGMSDLIFLAYNAAKRNGATSLSEDDWADTLEDISTEKVDDTPKATG